MRSLLLAFCALTVTGCATARAVPQPFPKPGGSVPTAAPASAHPAASSAVVRAALALRGTPYRNGGSTPAGFDCSGLVWYVFAQEGLAVPRTVALQWRAGRAVRRERLEPGDLVFFDTAGRPATHVGILVGPDAFVHAPSASGEVRVERISSRYWSARFVGGRRMF